jgi:hypothetical protein
MKLTVPNNQKPYAFHIQALRMMIIKNDTQINISCIEDAIELQLYPLILSQTNDTALASKWCNELQTECLLKRIDIIGNSFKN